MKIGRIATIAALVILLGLLATELVSLVSQEGMLQKENEEASQKLQAMLDENKKLQEGISYYTIPQNLEKNLRQKFNYTQPGEHMIIVVPSTPTTTPISD